MTLEERLNQVIEEKEEHIESLNNKLEEMKDREDTVRNKWMHHILFKSPQQFAYLPIPRLEMRMQSEPYNRVQFLYGLVFQPYYHDDGELSFVPLGSTSCGGKYTFGDTPLRDGVHIKKDTVHLGIPAFLVNYETMEWMPIEDAR